MKRTVSTYRIAAGLLALAMGAGDAPGAARQATRPFPGVLDEHPAIAYASRPVRDPVSRLMREIEAGRVTLDFRAPFGFLPALLRALDVPVESQVLVFSKTGLQGGLTGPRNPRALYFNDTTVVGYVAGAPFLEMASHDPRQGVVFHSLAQTTAPEHRAPAREARCLTCHVSSNSLEVPGMLTRSMFTAPDGAVLPQLGSFLVDHRTPLDQRWGGWYVTGTHGAMRHMGNALVTDVASPQSAITPATLNRTSLTGAFDARAYLSPHSDIVALLVFEHEMHAINLLTRLNWEARVAEAEHRLDVAAGDVGELIGELVDYFLFADEAPLTASIAGTSAFAETFASRGPRDRQGRSLRELELQTRLMRYPCSYMIYTEAFDSLPEAIKEAVYGRLWRVLSNVERSSRYARLSGADRRAIVEILRETKTGLPPYFR